MLRLILVFSLGIAAVRSQSLLNATSELLEEVVHHVITRRQYVLGCTTET